MKIYDISRELFSARVFPGDPVPSLRPVSRISEGKPCDLTEITLGTHNGTHMDAPRHFCEDGRTIDKLELEKCVGPCRVISCEGKLYPEAVEAALSGAVKRLLIKGNCEITPEAARAMTRLGLWFLGVEGLTVGPMESPMEVHKELLGHEVAILEAAILTEVPPGDYFLVSAPVKYGGIDGAQVRPLLLEFGDGGR